MNQLERSLKLYDTTYPRKIREIFMRYYVTHSIFKILIILIVFYYMVMAGFGYAYAEENHLASGQLDTLIHLAEAGNPEAQYSLAERYSKGIGVPTDDTKAFFWLEKAANQGFNKAQFLVANMYQYGFGVPKNSKMATHWYRKYEESFALKESDVQRSENQPKVSAPDQ